MQMPLEFNVYMYILIQVIIYMVTNTFKAHINFGNDMKGQYSLHAYYSAKYS